jgi:hypothetical protein
VIEDFELKLLNSINIIPEHIEVKESQIWKKKDLSKVKDLTTIEKTADWSFTSPYKGTILPCDELRASIASEIEIKDDIIEEIKGLTIEGSEGEKLEIVHDHYLPFKASLDLKYSEEIPLSKLGEENLIKHYGEVILFEDEFGDKGCSK